MGWNELVYVPRFNLTLHPYCVHEECIFLIDKCCLPCVFLDVVIVMKSRLRTLIDCICWKVGLECIALLV